MQCRRACGPTRRFAVGVRGVVEEARIAGDERVGPCLAAVLGATRRKRDAVGDDVKENLRTVSRCTMLVQKEVECDWS